MQATYRQLKANHDMIARSADALLLHLLEGRSPLVDIFGQLEHLASLVAEHVETESQIAAAVDSTKLDCRRRLAWVEGLIAFVRLKADWSTFIARWSLPAIEEDQLSFETAAMAMFERIGKRSQIEREAFYAVALQSGTIASR